MRYGYSVGENDEGSAGCLVLDYCGENVEYHFPYLGFDFRYVDLLFEKYLVRWL